MDKLLERVIMLDGKVNLSKRKKRINGNRFEVVHYVYHYGGCTPISERAYRQIVSMHDDIEERIDKLYKSIDEEVIRSRQSLAGKNEVKVYGGSDD